VANRQRRIDREHDRDSALTRVYAVEKEEGARRRTETERQRQKERAVCGIGEDFLSEDFFFEDSEKSSPSAVYVYRHTEIALREPRFDVDIMTYSIS